MTAITKEQAKRIDAIRVAVSFNSLGTMDPKFSATDVDLLLKRIEGLTRDDLNSPEDLLTFSADWLEENLCRAKEWLADAIEQARIAELTVKETEEALAAVRELIAGKLYTHGDGIVARWDAVEADLRERGSLPEYPAAPDPEPEAEPEAAPEPPPPPKTKPVRPVAMNVPASPREQEDHLYDALVAAAAGAPEIKISLKTACLSAGVALGSGLKVMRRLQADGRIEIIPDTSPGAKQPNTYRFVVDSEPETAPVAAEDPEPEPAPEPEPQPAPPAEEAPPYPTVDEIVKTTLTAFAPARAHPQSAGRGAAELNDPRDHARREGTAHQHHARRHGERGRRQGRGNPRGRAPCTALDGRIGCADAGLVRTVPTPAPRRFPCGPTRF